MATSDFSVVPLMILFQSTPPIRVATVAAAPTATHKALFQSTPPIRVATTPFQALNLSQLISIHATHTGGDRYLSLLLIGAWNFNPRHPYGWRQGTSLCCLTSGAFQSTPPIRVATWRSLMRCTCVSNFNPRHPYGWRRVQGICATQPP